MDQKEKTPEELEAERKKDHIKFIANLFIAEILNTAAIKKLIPMQTDESLAVRGEILRVSRSYLSKVLKQEMDLKEPVEGLALRCKRHVQIFCAQDVREIKLDLT